MRPNDTKLRTITTIAHSGVNPPSLARETLTQPWRESGIGCSRGVQAMLDREEKELYVGWSVILILAMALVYFQQ